MSTDPITTPTAIYYPLFYIIDAICAKSNKFNSYVQIILHSGSWGGSVIETEVPELSFALSVFESISMSLIIVTWI